MFALNVLMVMLTFGVKVARALAKRRTEARTERLASSLASGEVHPDLRRLGSRDVDLLASLMVEYLSLLRGAERDRLVRLAEATGLVRRCFDRLGSRNRWRRAWAALNLGYFGGPEAVAPLTRLLAHHDEAHRVWDYPYEANDIEAVRSEELRVYPAVRAGSETRPAEVEPLTYAWDGWNEPAFHERKKKSYAILREAFEDKELR